MQKFRKFVSYHNEWNALINHHRFDNCFQNLYEIYCDSSDSGEFFDKLANICKNIQSLIVYCSINHNHKSIYNLAQLIKAQEQIKHLSIASPTLPDELKKAILTHSQSIIFCRYNSKGENFIDSLPTFKNLKTLELTIYANNQMINLKNISLPNIESVMLHQENGYKY